MTLAMLIGLLPAVTLTAMAATTTYETASNSDLVIYGYDFFDDSGSVGYGSMFGYSTTAVLNADNNAVDFSLKDYGGDEVAFTNGYDYGGVSSRDTSKLTFKSSKPGSYKFTLLRDGYSSAEITITVTGGSTAPTLTATGGTQTFTENGSAVDLFSSVAAATNDTDQTFSGVTLTVSNVTDAKEYLSIGGNTVELTNGKSGTISGIGSYSVAVASNTATVTVSGMSLSDAQMGMLVSGITYGNTSDDPTAIAGSREIKITGITDSGSSSNSATPNIAATVSITAVNDAPTLTATTSTPTFTEDGSAAAIFSGASVSTVESSQTITELKLTVSNLADGSTEILNADGTDIVLIDGTTGTTATNSITYSVSVSAGTATVTLSKVSGITAAVTKTLVEGISYKNNSNTPTTTSGRVVTLTSIKDSGGTENSGADKTTLSIASTVTVAAVNDAPFTRDITSFLQLGAGTTAMTAGGTYATSQTDNITLEAWIYLENATETHSVLFNGNGGSSGYGIYLGYPNEATVSVLLGGSAGSFVPAEPATTLQITPF